MKNEALHHRKVVNYFEKSRLGYDMVLWGAKHFGFYPSMKKDIPEKKAQEIMQDVLAKELGIRKNELILDAGCGQGVVAGYLSKKHGCRIIGITITPFEVKKAAKLAEKLGVSNKVKYLLMDYSRTKFEDNKFDSVYTVESFVHSPNMRKTLSEFLRILKPGGKLVMFEYTIDADKEFEAQEKRILDLVIEVSAIESIKHMRHDKFPTVLKEAGFEKTKEKDISVFAGPSLERLHKLAMPAYVVVKAFGLQRNFINVTAAAELYGMAKKGLIRYCIFTARKPERLTKPSNR